MCILLAAPSRPAFADATLFIGSTTTPSMHTTKGFAIGVGLVIVGVEFEYASTTDKIHGTLGKIAWTMSTRAPPKNSRDTNKGSLGIRRVAAFGRLCAASTDCRTGAVPLSVPLVTAPLLPSTSRNSP